MSMDLEPAIQTFLQESRDLLSDFESSLLSIEGQPEDAELLSALFRSAHTIKGSAGVFGFDGIVEFTHDIESLLVELKEGRIVADQATVDLMLRCGDQIGALINCVERKVDPDDELVRVGAELSQQVNSLLRTLPVPSAEESPGNARYVESTGGGAVASDNWHISVRFAPGVLRDGMDPTSIVTYLASLGKIVSLQALFDGMPPLAELDPEVCYLGLELELDAPQIDKSRILDAFEFLGDGCLFHVLPPHSKLADYIRMINNLPEGSSRLGDLLIASGALTPAELAEGLREQASTAPGARPGVGEGSAQPLGEILIHQGSVESEVINAALKKQRNSIETRSGEDAVMRVRAVKLDELITLVGELVIAGAGTSMLAHQSRDGALIESAATMTRLVEEIRDRALRLRMVPIGDLFSRFKRVVHDLGAELGKEVELRFSGVETELDKSMIDGLGDPMLHLVRNALDHGIELPAERAMVGKASAGVLHLNAFHESGSIVVEVADDGRGLHRERIEAEAIRKGLIPADHQLDESAIHALIMEPGFSTAEEVTSVSGRGVGMDVVRRNIEALRGSVVIETEPGAGTKFVMRLPLTLAIIDGFQFTVGNAGFVVPLDSVVECVELPDSEKLLIRETGVIRLRGQALPVLNLQTMFELGSSVAKRENIIVVRHGNQRAGLLVHTLQGEFQTVIKPLGKLFRELRGISGSTILGSGEVALILDVAELIAHAVAAESAATRRIQLSGRFTRHRTDSTPGRLTANHPSDNDD